MQYAAVQSLASAVDSATRKNLATASRALSSLVLTRQGSSAQLYNSSKVLKAGLLCGTNNIGSITSVLGPTVAKQ